MFVLWPCKVILGTCGASGAALLKYPKNEIVLDDNLLYLWGKSNGLHMCPLRRNEGLRMGPRLISAWIHGSPR